MKKLTLFMFFIPCFVFAQPLPEWSSGISSDFYGYYRDNPVLKMDTYGDLIVAGNMMNGANGKDVLLIKYDTTGAIIWLRTYNGANSKDDELRDFTLDNNGNIYITGYTTIDSVDADILTLKFNSDGDLKWVNTYNGTVNRIDRAQSMDIEGNHSLYITGMTSIDTAGHNRVIAMKIDSAGNSLWTYVYPSDSVVRAEGQKVRLIHGKVKILGNIIPYDVLLTKYVMFDLDTAGNYIHGNEQLFKALHGKYYIDHIGNSYIGRHFGLYKITKIDTVGNIMWSDSVATNLPYYVTGDDLTAIAVDSLENVYVTGRHYGDYGGPIYTNADILTVKYSATGNLIWSRRYEYLSNNAADIGNAIFVDENLNVFVAGQSQSTVAGEDYDYVVLKYDVSGNLSGTIRYNDDTNGDDVITSVLVRGGSIYVTGLTCSSICETNTTTQKYRYLSGLGFEQVNESQFVVYPNPVTDHLLIKNPSGQVNQYSIITIDGKYVKTVAASNNPVDVTDLAPGVYLIANDEKSWFVKFIKL